MIQPKRDKEAVQRERFELMAVRLAKHLQWSQSDDFEGLPLPVKNLLNSFKYLDVVIPLIEHDRDSFGMSYRQLEIKYGVPKSTLHDYFSGKAKK